MNTLLESNTLLDPIETVRPQAIEFGPGTAAAVARFAAAHGLRRLLETLVDRDPIGMCRDHDIHHVGLAFLALEFGLREGAARRQKRNRNRGCAERTQSNLFHVLLRLIAWAMDAPSPARKKFHCKKSLAASVRWSV